jgi:hypothetical protein
VSYRARRYSRVLRELWAIEGVAQKQQERRGIVRELKRIEKLLTPDDWKIIRGERT